MDHRIMRAIEFIETHYGAAVSMRALSGCASLSPSRFRHLFRLETGMSPMWYLKEARLTKAAELLRESESLSIKEVMIKVGFTDKSQFTKCFRRRFGVSPRYYRRGIVNGRLVPIPQGSGKASELRLLSFKPIEQAFRTTSSRRGQLSSAADNNMIVFDNTHS